MIFAEGYTTTLALGVSIITSAARCAAAAATQGKNTPDRMGRDGTGRSRRFRKHWMTSMNNVDFPKKSLSLSLSLALTHDIK